MSKKLFTQLTAISFISSMNVAFALDIPMYLIAENGQGQSIGVIKAEESPCGVLLTPNLKDLPPGIHGFHIHQKPSCADKGMAAGGHLDPGGTDQHNGPFDKVGHLGDLPVLIVNQDGTATLPTLAPRFKLDNLKDHSLMIHAGADNYSDKPEKLGGGGARIACGVIANNNEKKKLTDTVTID